MSVVRSVSMIVMSAVMSVAMSTLVSGCGYHLRAWDLNTAFERAHVEADNSVNFSRELARALELAGIGLVDEPKDADVVVALTNQRESRYLVSVTGQARAAQYAMTLEVSFAARDRDGKTLLALQSLRAERVFFLDRSNIVGASEEQALLLREMRTDLVGRILRSLGSISRKEDGASQT